jgi:hypothetical protein
MAEHGEQENDPDDRDRYGNENRDAEGGERYLPKAHAPLPA